MRVETKASTLTPDAVNELRQLVSELPDGQLAHHFEERLKSLDTLLERRQRERRGPGVDEPEKRGPREGNVPTRRLPSTAEGLRRSGYRGDQTVPRSGGRSHPSF